LPKGFQILKPTAVDVSPATGISKRAVADVGQILVKVLIHSPGVNGVDPAILTVVPVPQNSPDSDLEKIYKNCE
jgi:hypothetical protein